MDNASISTGVGKALNEIPILSILNFDYIKNKIDINKRFLNYNKKLEAKYLNIDWQKNILNPSELARYEDLAYGYNGFSKNMTRYVQTKIEYIYKNSKNNKELKNNLQNLSNDIKNKYDNYANKDGFIDLKDLEYLKNEAGKIISNINALKSEKSMGKMIDDAENQEIFDKDKEIMAIKEMANYFTDKIWSSALDKEFIKYMKSYTNKNLENFNQAKDLFNDIIKDKSKASIKDTLIFIQEANKNLNNRELKEEENIFKNIENKSFKKMIYHEKTRILKGVYILTNPDDKNLLRFVNANRKEKILLLKDQKTRRLIILAIKNIQDRKDGKSGKISSKNANRLENQIRSINNNKVQLRSIDGDPNLKASSHDLLARNLALINIAKNAEITLDNFKDIEGLESLEKDIKDINADEIPPKIDLKFININKSYSTKFISAAERGGLNTKSLAKAVGKTWLGLTLFLNLMQAKSSGKLQDLFTNPYFIGSSAILGLPLIKKYNSIKNKMYSLSSKVGKRNLNRFISNPNEINIIYKILNKKDNKQNMKSLLKEVETRAKNNKKSPELRKEDFKGLIGKVISQKEYDLLSSIENSQLRYLFYKKLIINSKLNPRNFIEAINKWK